MQVHVLAEPAWGPQLPASVVLTATYGELHPGPSKVPIFLRNLSGHPMVIPTKVVIDKAALANQVPLVVHPTGIWGESTHGPPERLDSGEIEPSGSRGVAHRGTRSGQEAAGQMGTPVSLQWPGPGEDIPHQAPNWIDQPDTLQRVLLDNTLHIYNDVKAHLQEMQDICAI